MNTPAIGVIGLGLLMTSTSCTDALRPALCPGDSVTVAVTTSPGLPPQFSWSPPCLMAEVAVDSGPALMWVVVNSDTDRILPPVRYGHVPGGATQLVPPQRLTRAAQYRVVVGHRVVGSPDLLFRRAGVRVFVF